MLCVWATILVSSVAATKLDPSSSMEHTDIISMAKVSCMCWYQVQFGKHPENQVYLVKEYKVVTCAEEDDVYECRLLCANEMMNPRTHLPHAKGLAYDMQFQREVNIVSEACRLQQRERITVDVRYQMCNDSNFKFISFDYCCMPFYLYNTDGNSEEYKHLKKLSNEELPLDSHNTKVVWKFTPNDHCFVTEE